MPPTGSLSGSTFSSPALSLVIGGAKSGKSRIAEALVRLSGRPRTYLATAQAFDDEMVTRIDQHRNDRGQDWHTIEAPMHLGPALAEVPPEGIVLLDCATLWLTNHLLAESDLASETDALLENLKSCPAPVVVVTNEVGLCIVPDNRLARRFRDEQGRLNQRLAAQAELVVGVMAGLPFALKGTLPQGLV